MGVVQSVVESITNETATKLAKKAIEAVEQALPIMPLPEEGFSRGKFEIVHFSPNQKPLDYLEYESPDPGDNEQDQWQNGIFN